MAYTTGMRMSAGLHPGALMFYAVTTAEQAAEAAALLNAELVRLGAEGLESAEFEAAREGAAFQAARQCESSSAALVSSLLALYYHQEPDAPWRHEAEVRALGRAEVNGRLRNYFRHPPVVTGFAGRTPE